jgi:SRSO17 transposase
VGYESFFEVGNKNQTEKATQYLSGLFQCERKKRNMERMVEKVPESNYENIQHFISNSPWDTKGLMKEIAKNVNAELKPFGLIGCTVDEKAHLKKGNKSVGVARQYAGCSGKVDNAQVGVYLSLTASKYSSLTNFRLYLPEVWVSDKKRCLKAGIPEEKIVFKTKPALALEMIEEHIKDGVHFDFINGDGLYGNGYAFSKGIDKLGKKYVLDVHSDQRIFLQEPTIYLPEKQIGKRGRNPEKLKTDTPSITVSEYNKTLRKSDFKRVKIRKTTKGWLEANIHIIEVWVWDEAGQDKQEIKLTLIIRRPLHKKDKMKFSLSNIGCHEQSPEMFAFMQAQRYWVEKCFRDNSHDLGMSDYQVRTYRGWNNHMALTCLAMEYVLNQRLEFQTTIPLLSYNDVRELLIELIQNNKTNFNLKFDQMLVRHKQRGGDIKRYYPNNDYFDLPK